MEGGDTPYVGLEHLAPGFPAFVGRQRQIVELCVACEKACSAQRMAAALQVELGDNEEAFCRENGIETDVLSLKYPLIQS